MNERIVKNVIATQAFEGMHLSEKEVETLRKQVSGEVSCEQVVKDILKKYQ